MAKPEAIISLAERLKTHARRACQRGDDLLAADLRWARCICRQYVAILIVEEAQATDDPVRRMQLLEEVVQLRMDDRRHGVR